MDAGLLFFQAHRTSLCELEVRKAAANLRVTVQGVNASARYEGLCRALASFLKKYPLLYLVSAVEGGRLLCAEPVFRALHVPLDEHGEPEHVRRLTGFDACGYLLESRTQAIVLLPDLPEEQMCIRDRLCTDGRAPGENLSIWNPGIRVLLSGGGSGRAFARNEPFAGSAHGVDHGGKLWCEKYSRRIPRYFHAWYGFPGDCHYRQESETL